jgi:hypothetical protein
MSRPIKTTGSFPAKPPNSHVASGNIPHCRSRRGLSLGQWRLPDALSLLAS